MPLNSKTIQSTIKILKTKYKCHTAILYGSYARGDNNSFSDIDVLGVTSKGKSIHDGRKIGNQYLDAFIVPESECKCDDELIRAKDGIVLFEKNQFGTNLLTSIKAHYNKGPKKLDENNKRQLVVWCNKMLERATKDDTEGKYRKIWLLNDLLSIYFILRDRWYLGPKESFAYLKINEPKLLKKYVQALAKMNLKTIKDLISHVTKPQKK